MINSEAVNDSVVSQHSLDFWRTLALNALRVLRSFIKMNAEQSAAWDIVISLIGGSNA